MDYTRNDIQLFGNVVNGSYTRLFGELIDEVERIRRIEDDCDEWLSRYKAYSITQFGDRQSFYRYIFGTPVRPVRIAGGQRALSKDDVIRLFPERKQLLRRIIDTMEPFAVKGSRFFPFKTTVQYAVFKQQIAEGMEQFPFIVPYNPTLLTPSEQVAYLRAIHHVDRKLSKELLSHISHRIGNLGLYQAICDDNDAEAIRILSSSDERYPQLASDITAMDRALRPFELRLVKDSSRLCQCVHETFFLTPNFSLNEREEELLSDIRELDIPNIPETWSDSNYASPDPIKVLNETSTIITHCETTVVQDNEPCTEQPPQPDAILSTQPERVDCPPAFKNDNTPERFRALYKQLEHKYIAPCEDVFLYRFSAPGVTLSDVTNIPRITWHNDMWELKCLLVALYEDPQNPSKKIPYKKFEPLFQDKNGKRYNLSSNALIWSAVNAGKEPLDNLPYDGNRGRAAYDQQAEAIKTFRDMVIAALAG